MSPRKGFDADGGAFTLSCSLLCCAVLCRGVVWCAGTLGRVGADNGDLSLKWGPGVGCPTWAPSLGRVFRRPAVGDLPLLCQDLTSAVSVALGSVHGLRPGGPSQPFRGSPRVHRYNRNCMKCSHRPFPYVTCMEFNHRSSTYWPKVFCPAESPDCRVKIQPDKAHRQASADGVV